MKLFALFGALLMLALTGCAAIPFTDEARARGLLENLSQFYRTDALVSAGDQEFRVQIHRPDPLHLTVELLYPERLSGFRYTFGDGVVELGYMGLTFNLDPFGATRTAPIPRATQALSSLLIPQADRPLPILQNDLWQLESEFDGERVLLLIDRESELPLKLLLESAGVGFVFENFVFLS